MARPSLPAPQLLTPPGASSAQARLDALAHRLRQDDLVAFEEVFRLTFPEAARAFFFLLGPGEDLERPLQDCYRRLFTSLRTGRPGGPLLASLHRACAEVAARWRGNRGAPSLSDWPGEDAQADSPQEDARRAAALAREALARLDVQRRVTLVFVELLGLAPAEVAQALSTPAAAVGRRLQTARADFSRALAAAQALHRDDAPAPGPGARGHDEALLWSSAAGELPPDESALLAHHLEDCPECREALHDVRSARALLAQARLLPVPASAEGTGEVVEGLVERALQARARGTSRWRGPVLALGAVAVVGLAVAWAGGPGGPRDGNGAGPASGSPSARLESKAVAEASVQSPRPGRPAPSRRSVAESPRPAAARLPRLSNAEARARLGRLPREVRVDVPPAEPDSEVVALAPRRPALTPLLPVPGSLTDPGPPPPPPPPDVVLAAPLEAPAGPARTGQKLSALGSADD